MRRALLAASASAALAFSFMAGWMLGMLGGERGAYHRRYLEDRDRIAPVLAADPAFSGVAIEESSGGGADLIGEVESADDVDRLRRDGPHLRHIAGR